MPKYAYELRVDWSTAKVEPAKKGLVLRVRVNEEPDDFWLNTFQEMHVRARFPSEECYINAMPTYGGEIGVHFVPGAEDGVHANLDDLVAAVNVEAAGAHERWDAEQAAKAEREAELVRAAKEAEEHFRA